MLVFVQKAALQLSPKPSLTLLISGRTEYHDCLSKVWKPSVISGEERHREYSETSCGHLEYGDGKWLPKVLSVEQNLLNRSILGFCTCPLLPSSTTKDIPGEAALMK